MLKDESELFRGKSKYRISGKKCRVSVGSVEERGQVTGTWGVLENMDLTKQAGGGASWKRYKERDAGRLSRKCLHCVCLH